LFTFVYFCLLLLTFVNRCQPIPTTAAAEDLDDPDDDDINFITAAIQGPVPHERVLVDKQLHTAADEDIIGAPESDDSNDNTLVEEVNNIVLLQPNIAPQVPLSLTPPVNITLPLVSPKFQELHAKFFADNPPDETVFDPGTIAPPSQEPPHIAGGAIPKRTSKKPKPKRSATNEPLATVDRVADSLINRPSTRSRGEQTVFWNKDGTKKPQQ
jgi:hypothetical protein